MLSRSQCIARSRKIVCAGSVKRKAEEPQRLQAFLEISILVACGPIKRKAEEPQTLHMFLDVCSEVARRPPKRNKRKADEAQRL